MPPEDVKVELSLLIIEAVVCVAKADLLSEMFQGPFIDFFFFLFGEEGPLFLVKELN